MDNGGTLERELGSECYWSGGVGIGPVATCTGLPACSEPITVRGTGHMQAENGNNRLEKGLC